MEAEGSNFNLIPNAAEDKGDGVEPGNELEELISVVGSAEGGEQTMHPLLLSPVMPKVFKNLSHQELATYREVCREWRDGSLSTWRSTSTVWLANMGFDSRPKCISARYGKSNIPEKLHDLLEFCGDQSNKCDLKPYSDFTLLFWAFGLDSDQESSGKFGEEQLLVERFWHGVGTHITSLTLRCCGFFGIEDARKVMYVACPNLQHLAMVNCPVKPKDYNEDDYFVRNLIYQYPSNEAVTYTGPTFEEHIHMRSLTLDMCLPDSWLEMLSHFSSLTTLNISGFSTFNELNTPELLKAVQAIRQSCCRRLPLTKVSPLGLNKEGSKSPVNFALLSQFGLPLGEMWSSLSDGVDYDFLSSALRDHARTLKSLVVCPDPDHPTRFPSRVELQNVTKFHLYNGLLENFYFLENLPNLEILVLSTWFDEERSEIADMFANTSELEMADLKLTKVKKLELEYEMTENNLRRLAQWLPNLEELKMPLDDMLLRVVCENWKGLIKLTDTSDQITDMGVIAMALGDGWASITPVIVLLRRLERFKSASEKLTWTAVDFGFIKMCSLNYLNIPLMEAITEVTGENRDELIGKGALKLRTQMGVIYVLPTD